MGTSMAAVPVSFATATERYEDAAEIEARVRASFGSRRDDLTSCIGELLIADLHGRAGDARRAALQIDAVRAHPIFQAITEPTWLALLADACHVAEDRALAERLYQALTPRANRFFTLGHLSPLLEPPYARRLGLLALTLDSTDEAVRHLSLAEASTERAGMRAHLARLRLELARALLARDAAGDRERARALLDDARGLASALDQRALLPWIDASARAIDDAEPVSSALPTARVTLAREGDVWRVTYGAHAARVKDSRGLQVLARLVDEPGRELHVLQLATKDVGDAGDAGELLDRQAVASYRARLLDLREELEDADARADAGRAERARAEIDVLTSELARAVGLGGRERRAGVAAERARTTVQKRLRDAVQRIRAASPELGLHLEQTVRTGTFCGYFPNGRRRTNLRTWGRSGR